jgi:hypothetical protein
MYRAIMRRLFRAVSRDACSRPLGLRVESLESREVPTILVWSGASSPYWSDPGNWNPVGLPTINQAPSTGDTLVFMSGGLSIDDYPSGFTIGGVVETDCYTGTIEIPNNLNVPGGWTNYGTAIVMSGATLTTSNFYQPPGSGSLVIQGGALGSGLGLGGGMPGGGMPGGGGIDFATGVLDMWGGTFITGTLEPVNAIITTGGPFGGAWSVLNQTNVTGSITVGVSGSLTVGNSAMMQQTPLTISGGLGSAGLVSLSNGTTLTVGASISIVGGTFAITGGVVINTPSVTLNASGTLEYLASAPASVATISGNVYNTGGTIQFDAFAENLQINGDFSQSIGTLIMQYSYNFTTADELNVDGDVTLGGTLTVIAVDTPPPTAGPSSFTLISSASSISGNFLSATFPPPPPGTVIDYGVPSPFPIYLFSYLPSP